MYAAHALSLHDSIGKGHFPPRKEKERSPGWCILHERTFGVQGSLAPQLKELEARLQKDVATQAKELETRVAAVQKGLKGEALGPGTFHPFPLLRSTRWLGAGRLMEASNHTYRVHRAVGWTES